MKKPKLSDLPGSVYEEILWDVDLEYDSYESSKPDTIHSLICGNGSLSNKEKIERYYEQLTAEEVHAKMLNKFNELENQLAYLKECMFKCVCP